MDWFDAGYWNFERAWHGDAVAKQYLTPWGSDQGGRRYDPSHDRWQFLEAAVRTARRQSLHDGARLLLVQTLLQHLVMMRVGRNDKWTQPSMRSKYCSVPREHSLQTSWDSSMPLTLASGARVRSHGAVSCTRPPWRRSARWH